MWPRVSEFFLGVWLMMSQFIFVETPVSESFAARDLFTGGFVAVLSVLSFWRRTARAHLMTAAVSAGLLAVAYFGSSRPGPPAAQNEITTALLLLMLAIIPNNANRPPTSWLQGQR